jgi:hypothetical protein
VSTVPGRRMWTWVFRNEDPFDQKLFGLHQPIQPALTDRHTGR